MHSELGRNGRNPEQKPSLAKQIEALNEIIDGLDTTEPSLARLGRTLTTTRDLLAVQENAVDFMANSISEHKSELEFSEDFREVFVTGGLAKAFRAHAKEIGVPTKTLIKVIVSSTILKAIHAMKAAA